MMKRWLLLWFVPLPLWAAPFVACDVAPQVTHTQMQPCMAISSASCTTWGAWSADVPVVTVGAAKECRHDVATAPVGANIVRLRAVAVDPAWGRQESVPGDPFAFSRPASPTSPAAMRLIP